MDLQAYFERIGFHGVAKPDLATLRALHRAHLLAVPYENLDVQLGRPVSRDPARAYEKIVGQGRGGWCYEMNGVLGWALEEVGFRVTRMAGGVARALRGDDMVGNHLVLKVDLEDGAWIADVGFGDGALDPVPLQAAPVTSNGFEMWLEALPDGWWRLHNHPQGGAPSYDFRDEPADPARLEERCGWLQSAAESIFVQNAVAQRHRLGSLLQLRGRVLRQVSPDRVEERLLTSADEYVEVLARDFDLDLPEAAGLWPRITARHAELFGEPA